ncbi:MAG TPA: CRISPR-associated protein Csx15 [Alphaproteobacteria bacterium]|nr:CRISPR-associated protein Csx15 [Alphaproteobacteria bacterium]
MVVINFAHPLTPDQLGQLERLTGQAVARVIDVQTQFDHARPFVEQARALVEAVGLSAQAWQTTPLLVNLPSLNVIAALVLAELHGRCGYFPPVLRLMPVPNALPPQFQVAEIVNLQAVREAARAMRGQGEVSSTDH